jgi:hypothetical protein
LGDMDFARNEYFATRGRALVSAAFLCVVACSGTESGSNGSNPASSDLPSCAGASQSLLKIEGDLEAAPVHVDQSPAGGGFSQLATGQFDTPLSVTINGMPVPPAPGETEVHLQWQQTIPDGSSTAASGTVVLPSGDPRAGETVCAGQGSEVVMPLSGDFMQFDLQNLRLGAACDQALGGRLRGCWSSGISPSAGGDETSRTFPPQQHACRVKRDRTRPPPPTRMLSRCAHRGRSQGEPEPRSRELRSEMPRPLPIGIG